jgi:hypothetical protein
MASPLNGPLRSQGASHTTGGIICGRAQGNVFNHADLVEFGHDAQLPLLRQGQVQVYMSFNQVKPTMAFKHEVTPTLAPVLKSLTRRYSDFSSEYCC